mgnify:FL=1
MDERNLNVVRVKLIDDTPLFGNELIQTANDAIFLMQKELRNCDRETFCALHLNPKGKPLSMSIISMGELSSAPVHPREVFKASILSNAAGVIFMHNHPSGDLTPSEEDRKTTKRMEAAGKLLGIHVVDHIIVGENKANYYSFRANDLLNPDEEKRKQKQKKQSPKHKEQEAR